MNPGNAFLLILASGRVTMGRPFWRFKVHFALVHLGGQDRKQKKVFSNT